MSTSRDANTRAFQPADWPTVASRRKQAEDRGGADDPSDDLVMSLADHRLGVVLDGSGHNAEV
ncbi:MAG: hypothetical protein ACXVH1_32385 [Solirubrobacteraceae bacterium]